MLLYFVSLILTCILFQLHIDAHSDMAPPEMVEDYPVFRWPKDNRDVKAMMQSNDVFIQVNIITDIIIAYFPTKGIRSKGFGSACFFPKMVVSLSHLFQSAASMLSSPTRQHRSTF